MSEFEWTQDFDLSEHGECGVQLDPAYLINVSCQLPNLEWIHVINDGHCGWDADNYMWNWNEYGARMIIPRSDV